MEVDQPRFLGRKYGYQPTSHNSPDELEAIDATTQERLSLAARRREQARLIAAWMVAHTAIEEALSAFLVAAPSKHLRDDVRYIRHGLSRLDRRVRR